MKDDDCVALFSGSMVEKQNLPILVEAAQHCAEIQFVFAGNGVEKDKIVAATADASNVHHLDTQPLERLNDLLNLADIHLLPQVPAAADLVLPSKLTSQLASGRPIVATVTPDSGIAQTGGEALIATKPGDAQALADALNSLAKNPQERQKRGKIAREIAERDWNRHNVLANFEEDLYSLLERVAAGTETRSV